MNITTNASLIPYEGEDPYIFISYSHKDSDLVFPLINQLNSKGYRIWLDKGLNGGDEFHAQICRHIKNASAVIVFLSPYSNKSRYIAKEIDVAFKNSKPIVPVFLKETVLSDTLEILLGSYQHLFFYKYENDDEFIEKLLSSIKIKDSMLDQSKIDKVTFKIAFEHAKYGVDLHKKIPVYSVDDFIAVEPNEISGYQNFKTLVDQYAANRRRLTPLSIASFSTEGSPRKYGIETIVKKAFEKVRIFEIDLSLFTSEHDLMAVFQQARDVFVLGNLPLVFFNNFDAPQNGKPFTWIKSFISAQAHGEFKDNYGCHPLGRGVFVFKSEIYKNYENFKALRNSDDFIESKGPELIKYLDGSLDTYGVNPVAGREDNTYVIRRAVLIHNLMKTRQVPQCDMDISDNYIRALLLVPHYHYDAHSLKIMLSIYTPDRSFEDSIIEFSNVSTHVDIDSFRGLLLRDIIKREG